MEKCLHDHIPHVSTSICPTYLGHISYLPYKYHMQKEIFTLDKSHCHEASKYIAYITI